MKISALKRPYDYNSRYTNDQVTLDFPTRTFVEEERQLLT